MAYEAVEPHDAGMLDVGDGQRVHWEVCGDPDGKPAVVLHGGPGSGCSPLYRRFFDPSRYRAVLFDQRGCGRSTPSVADPDTDLSVNTTQHLVRDIEVLREHLSIEGWLVFGLSWGSTLALAYAQQHPDRVSELVVGLVATTSRREVTWITRDVGRLIPEHWERFRDHVLLRSGTAISPWPTHGSWPTATRPFDPPQRMPGAHGRTRTSRSSTSRQRRSMIRGSA